MLRIKKILPLLTFLILAFFLLQGLTNDPHKIPSPLISHKVPKFSAENLIHPTKTLNQTMFIGHFSLLNVFASWCGYCIYDHAVLRNIKKHHRRIKIFGLSYKDTRVDVLAWLKKYGNPYQAIIDDRTGRIAINFGVYGTPETFLIDPKGVVRYKFSGPLTYQVWQQKILPIVKKELGKNA